MFFFYVYSAINPHLVEENTFRDCVHKIYFVNSKKAVKTSILPILPQYCWRPCKGRPLVCGGFKFQLVLAWKPGEFRTSDLIESLVIDCVLCATVWSNDADFPLCHIVCAWKRYMHTGQEPPPAPSSLSPSAVCLPVPVVLLPSSVSLTPKHCSFSCLIFSSFPLYSSLHECFASSRWAVFSFF